MKLGEALTQAIETWLRKREVSKRSSLLEIKPFSWGEDTEKASVEIDQIPMANELDSDQLIRYCGVL